MGDDIIVDIISDFLVVDYATTTTEDLVLKPV
jgi:hypothetical protein